jgi:isopentenyl diphosphate isomerase/L-lactate dehydrogenase-like FMN-dependent dehydrogenase
LTDVADPGDLITIDQVISRARDVIDPARYEWAAAGAGQGVTTSRNMLALNRLALMPHMMKDVSQVSTATSFLGVPLALPVVLAPVAALGVYDTGDALAAAAAAADVGTSAFCAVLTGSDWEEVAATAPGRHFFQIYPMGDRGWHGDIADRVEAAGFAGICVTVDSPVIGRRDRSLESGFTWSVAAGELSGVSRHGHDYAFRPKFTWAELAWLCARTRLPVVVKGVMTPADAAESIECGVAGVYVSNHGGRMVDHAISTIEVLGEVVEAVDGRAEVAIDSGFTRGAEICKALALGARVVGIGRLQCWGLALGGAAGLTRVLEILDEEITTTMANIGAPTISDLTPDHVRWSIPAPPNVL